MELTPGHAIGRYRLERRLGAGAQGVVWQAEDTKLRRPVAIKFLRDDAGADELVRLDREARTMARIAHPGIVQILDRDRVGKHDFLVIEFVPGRTLRELLEPGPLQPAPAVRLGSDVAQALAAAHDAGVVHRDLKPENVLITGTGETKVLDLGLASCAAVAGDGGSALGGTPGYMAPEVVLGEHAGSASADLWALGCILFEALSGQRAAPGLNADERLHATVHADPAWAALPASLPAALVELLGELLSRQPARRPAGMHEVARRLDQLGSHAEKGDHGTGHELAPPRTNAHLATAIVDPRSQEIWRSEERLLHYRAADGAERAGVLAGLACQAVDTGAGGAFLVDVAQGESLGEAIARALEATVRPPQELLALRGSTLLVVEVDGAGEREPGLVTELAELVARSRLLRVVVVSFRPLAGISAVIDARDALDRTATLSELPDRLERALVRLDRGRPATVVEAADILTREGLDDSFELLDQLRSRALIVPAASSPPGSLRVRRELARQPWRPPSPATPRDAELELLAQARLHGTTPELLERARARQSPRLLAELHHLAAGALEPPRRIHQLRIAMEFAREARAWNLLAQLATELTRALTESGAAAERERAVAIELCRHVGDADLLMQVRTAGLY